MAVLLPAGTVIAVDTNVSIRVVEYRLAAQAGTLGPQHVQVRAAIRTLKSPGCDLCFFPQNVVEMWAVLTRPASQRGGLGFSTAQASRAIRMAERFFPVLLEDPAVLAEWKRLVGQHGVAGVETYDARLVAAMKVHSVGHLLTFDKDDFKRYVATGEIATIDPATV